MLHEKLMSSADKNTAVKQRSVLLWCGELCHRPEWWSTSQLPCPVWHLSLDFLHASPHQLFNTVKDQWQRRSTETQQTSTVAHFTVNVYKKA